MDYIKYSYNNRNSTFVYRLVNYLVQRFGMRHESLLSIGAGDGAHETAFSIFTNVTTLNDLSAYDAEKDKIPYPANSFDFVFIKSVIEHIENTDLFLSEIKRVLKVGGKVIILTPDYTRQRDFFHDDYTHIKPFTLEGLKMATMLNGMKIYAAEHFWYYEAIWRHAMVPNPLPIRFAYWLTKKTGIKYFRWGADRQLLVVGEKEE